MKSPRRTAYIALTVATLLTAAARPGAAADPATTTAGRARAPIVVPIFRDVALHFHADSASKFAHGGIAVEDHGRVARATVVLPSGRAPQRITALVTVRPVFKSDREVFDRYDRAGNVRLVIDGAADLEVVRFMTAYGGRTDYAVDVSQLAPLLRGRRTFRAFIDTWTSPAWRLDLSLRYERADSVPAPAWVAPVYYRENFNREGQGAGESATVTIPPGLERVVMKYISTGHCTDGRDEDEFVSKANVISVDGVVVSRLHPWRDDCRRFRELNPYCARWSDGSWSSDYARSGWCPSQEVTPLDIDLTDHLTPGDHTIRFAVEGMRPRDAQGNYGYWRISAYLVGWKRAPSP